MQLHPDLSKKCCLPDVTNCNAVMLLQLHPDLSAKKGREKGGWEGEGDGKGKGGKGGGGAQCGETPPQGTKIPISPPTTQITPSREG